MQNIHKRLDLNLQMVQRDSAHHADTEHIYSNPFIYLSTTINKRKVTGDKVPPTDLISSATQVQTVYKRNLCKKMLKLITEKSVVNP
jgi:hypothetical protein